MLILKVAPIEAAGIIASIITAVIFVGVLGFQIRATNAARRVAEVATAQIDRLRPHVTIDSPDDPINLIEMGWDLIFKIKNVGFATAYNVTMQADLTNREGELVGETDDDFAPQDLPPGVESDFLIIGIGEDRDLMARDLIQSREGEPKIQIVVRFALFPESSQSHESTKRLANPHAVIGS